MVLFSLVATHADIDLETVAQLSTGASELATSALAGSPAVAGAIVLSTCNRFEIAEFGVQALALDIRYLGVCCGAGPHHIRALAEAVGKRPPASRYSADMSKHAFLGSHQSIKKVQKDYANKL